MEKQIPDTMKARNMTKEQVINDVLLEAQPTKEFVTSDQVAALALYLCGDDASQITGANLSMDGGWTAAMISTSSRSERSWRLEDEATAGFMVRALPLANTGLRAAERYIRLPALPERQHVEAEPAAA